MERWAGFAEVTLAWASFCSVLLAHAEVAVGITIHSCCISKLHYSPGMERLIKCATYNTLRRAGDAKEQNERTQRHLGKLESCQGRKSLIPKLKIQTKKIHLLGKVVSVHLFLPI